MANNRNNKRTKPEQVKPKITTLEQHTKLIEERMGMTIAQFHKKLNELLSDDYLQQARDNHDFVQQWLASSTPIYTLSWDQELQLSDDEYFTQLFDPDKPVRNELPTYWHMSNFGNLISIWTTPGTTDRRVIWLPPKPKDAVRGIQGWIHAVTGHNRTVRHHALVSLLTDTHVSSYVQKMFEIYGSYSFGSLDDPFAITVHHERGVALYPDCVYDEDNLATLSSRIHNLMKQSRTSVVNEADYMTQLDRALQNEEPTNKPVAFITGKLYDKDGHYLKDDRIYKLRQLKSLTLSPKDYEYLVNLSKSIQQVI